mmetsp:Transcript_17762/g.42778  ORF Transcript_17762/g.42778 Transcript_17762/m.42778 type:complete len:395 (+) Transcript_17762:120-1304(+)|eukprot:CAMPEP_0181120012 /NCGR_PEP_ID=MMETSP1071-20121207/23913_1 /TAXON_ID=35127 /ORGANISM="Thalassiosira sp., Strain NH16" /LENGTH=394 /DNA_ID=CAMNT_0023204607 /DNA_START=105 /DNA_END=1289 /DNA_ORIENTATION=-
MTVKLRQVNSLLRRKKFDFVPPSHWRSLGHGDDYITEITNLQLSLMNYIRRPSRVINLQPINTGVHLQHDDLLSKLWKYFAIALIHRDDCGIDSFRIINVQLVPSVLAQLARALKAKKIRTFVLHNNNFESHGVVLAAKVLKENSTLNCMSLNFHQLDNVESAIQLSDALCEHPFLETLSLRYCSFWGGSIALSSIVSACKNVKFLDLRNTGIGSEGAAIVARFLATNPNMETINLSNNNFNDGGAEIIARGLSTNTNLKLLYISRNPIFEAGKRALLKAIFDTTSLNATIDSNHSCELIFDNIASAHDMAMLINNFTGKDTNRKRKIVFAIHDAVIGPSAFSLQNVPVQLAPDVLGLIQFGPLRYMSSSLMYNYSLTLTYEVMRCWLCGYLEG